MAHGAWGGKKSLKLKKIMGHRAESYGKSDGCEIINKRFLKLP
jgi:hypothetical protein